MPPRTDDAPLVTGEAVALDIRVARLGSRTLALLIDLVVQAILAVGLAMVAAVIFNALYAAGAADLNLAIAQTITVMVLVFVGYPVALLTLTRGRTVGKLALGVRVVRDDGGPIGFRHSLSRTMVAAAVEFPGVLLPFGGAFVSAAVMTASPLSKRLGDYAAGTFVIHERNLAAWGWTPAMPAPLAAWAATLDLTGFDDELALAVRHYLARNRRLREPYRTRLGRQLAQQVAEQASPPPPPDTPGWAYLAAVYAERHARAMRRLSWARQRAAAVWPDLLPPPPVVPTAPMPYPPPPFARPPGPGSGPPPAPAAGPAMAAPGPVPAAPAAP